MYNEKMLYFENLKNKYIEFFIEENPELQLAMEECSHSENEHINPYHMEGSVWTHTMLVVNEAVDFGNRNVILAALLHDIGKVEAREVVEKDDGIRVRFTNHASASVFMSFDILKEFQKTVNFDVITDDDIIEIINLIALHDIFFSSDNAEFIASKLYGFDNKFINSLLQLILSDNRGRICDNANNNIENLINDVLNIVGSFSPVHSDTNKTVEFLVGVPYVGKSYYTNKVLTDNPTVISRDNIVMELGGSDYNKAFSTVNQQEVDTLLMKRYNDAIDDKNVHHIIIDMTNMSKKSRKKFLSDKVYRNCNVKATVFYIGNKELDKRIDIRSDKVIPEAVMRRFIFSYTMPMFDEVDEVSFRLAKSL